MREFKTDSQRAEMVEHLVNLAGSEGWKYMKERLNELKEQAKNEIMSTPIIAKAVFSVAESTRREFKYLDTLIGMPEAIASVLQEKGNMGVEEFDPQKPASGGAKPSPDDAYDGEDDSPVARPDDDGF